MKQSPTQGFPLLLTGGAVIPSSLRCWHLPTQGRSRQNLLGLGLFGLHDHDNQH